MDILKQIGTIILPVLIVLFVPGIIVVLHVLPGLIHCGHFLKPDVLTLIEWGRNRRKNLDDQDSRLDRFIPRLLMIVTTWLLMMILVLRPILDNLCPHRHRLIGGWDVPQFS